MRFVGTENEWNDSIGYVNFGIDDATLYYSETEPTTTGNYWHYVNGEIVVW